MRRIVRDSMVAAAAAAAIAAATGAAAAAGGDDSEPELTGDALSRASEAALAHTGGGAVTGTEVGDEESRYEVEVTLPNGKQVDVQLDESFAVVGSDADVEGQETTAPSESWQLRSCSRLHVPSLTSRVSRRLPSQPPHVLRQDLVLPEAPMSTCPTGLRLAATTSSNLPRAPDTPVTCLEPHWSW